MRRAEAAMTRRGWTTELRSRSKTGGLGETAEGFRMEADEQF
jgi:hypothetical protein